MVRLLNKPALNTASRTITGISMHPTPEEHQGRDGGTAASLRAHALRAVRHFAWLGVGSVKVALSRPRRAPGWCPIPPTSTPQKACGAYPTREEHLGDASRTPAVGCYFGDYVQ